MEFWSIGTGLPGCEHIVSEVVRLNKQECPKQRRKDCNCQPASPATHGLHDATGHMQNRGMEIEMVH
jgi:hypothetical protein